MSEPDPTDVMPTIKPPTMPIASVAHRLHVDLGGGGALEPAVRRALQRRLHDHRGGGDEEHRAEQAS